MPTFRRQNLDLGSPNVSPDWTETGAWRRWIDGPLNVVRGESQYQEEIRLFAGSARPGGWLVPVEVILRREAKNRHDPNAIRAEIEDRLVGYLAREIAAQIAPVLDRHSITEFSVPGLIRGGWRDESDLGVHLWLHRRLSAGPSIVLQGMEAFAVEWPPFEDEGVGESGL